MANPIVIGPTERYSWPAVCVYIYHSHLKWICAVLPVGGSVCPEISDHVSNMKKKKVHGVFLVGWPALDLACQNCIETGATWDKVTKMCVKSCCYIIKCERNPIMR